MGNGFTIIRKGESLPFVFDRSGEEITDWVCTIEVKRFPSDTSVITPRIIEPVDRTWPGFLTSTESATLDNKAYRLIGVLKNAVTNEEEQVMETTRFNITSSWAS